MTPTHCTTRHKGACCVLSLGCAKNLVDSEHMLGLLKENGYLLVHEPQEADFVLVNTCGFIEPARRESLDAIHQMVELKQQGTIRGVIVAGCLAERDRELLLETCPGIDELVGVFACRRIVEAAERVMGGSDRQRTTFLPAAAIPPDDSCRLRLTPPHLAFLKIAEGCNRSCTFCTIPGIRGAHASKPIEQVVEEAERLAAEGTRELILVSQDTSYYGLDRYGRVRLAELLRRLEAVAGIEWIRLMYLYPADLSEELIELVAGGGRILPYLDVPLQHISDPVLRRMNRRVTRAQQERLIDRLRERIDELVLRTTLMAGFPGETQEQFEELLRFVGRRRFERLGVLAYCREEGTPSARLGGQLPEEVKQARRDRLLAAQQEIAFAWNESQVGRRLDVLIDRDIAGEKNAYLGRSYADAPEVDPVVYTSGQGLAPGQIVPCEIVAWREYDLIGVAVGEPR